MKEILTKLFNDNNIDHTYYEFKNQLSAIISPENLLFVATELKNNPELQFDMLLDITAIDWWEYKTLRFETVYFLYSTIFKHRIRIKVQLHGEFPECPSVVNIWESANWYERETFDMYGIKFIGHPSLRRFYMPEDMCDPDSGEPLYPLRKEFPMMGIPDSLPMPPYPEKVLTN